MGSRNCALAALIVARARAAGHISEKSGGLMWPCDGGWACGYNACIPAATCGHARAVLLAKIGQAQDPWASVPPPRPSVAPPSIPPPPAANKGAAADVMSELKQALRARG